MKSDAGRLLAAVATAMYAVCFSLPAAQAELRPQFCLQWGSSGYGNGQWSGIGGMATDIDGNVYAVDAGNQRVQKFSNSGKFLKKWGSSGSGNGQFTSPSGIATDLLGNVYVADTGNDRIQKFSASGKYLAQWGTSGSNNSQFYSPAGLATDGNGYVYVADRGNNRIQKFTSDGSFVIAFGSYGYGPGQFASPHSIAVDGNGNIYVTDTGYFQKLTSTGICIYRQGPQIYGDVAVHGTNDVYVALIGTVCQGNTIYKFDAAGNEVLAWGSYGTGKSQFHCVSVITTDPRGNVFAADNGNSRIEKFYKTPILLVQGYCSTEAVWANVQSWFVNQGSPTYTVTFDDIQARPKDNVAALAAEIAKIPNGPVMVVAHGTGGLVAREYIRQCVASHQPTNIGKLVTYGTPYHGLEAVGMIDVFNAMPTGSSLKQVFLPCDVSRDCLTDLQPGSGFLNVLNYENQKSKWDKGTSTNITHAAENLYDPAVRYYSFTGTQGLCAPYADVANALVWNNAHYPNDGVVGYLSGRLYASGTNNWVDTDFTQRYGFSDTDNMYFCWPGYLQSSDLFLDLLYILVDQFGSSPAIAQNSSSDQTPPILQSGSITTAQLPELSGQVAARQIIERPFRLPSTDQLQVMLSSINAHLGIRLPNGQLLLPSDTATVAGLRFLRDPHGGLEILTLTNPPAGTWSLRVDATNGFISQQYVGLVRCNSVRTISLQVSAASINPGQSTTITAHIDSAGTPLCRTTWNCSTTGPDGTRLNIALYDDGTHGDSLAADGTFTAVVQPAGPLGFYALAAQAMCSDSVTFAAAGNIELTPFQDLAILSDDVHLSKNVVSEGDAVNISAVVHNYSPTAVTNVPVEFWDDQLGTRIDSVTVTLPANGSTIIAVPWNVAPADTHVVRVTVSPFTLVSEQSYDNNSGILMVVPGQPVAVPMIPEQSSLRLDPSVPNPSSGSTTLRFSLPRASDATLIMTDVLGRRIKQWHWTMLTAGPHHVSWDGQADDGRLIPPGILFYRLDVGNQQLKQKLIHLQ